MTLARRYVEQGGLEREDFLYAGRRFVDMFVSVSLWFVTGWAIATVPAAGLAVALVPVVVVSRLDGDLPLRASVLYWGVCFGVGYYSAGGSSGLLDSLGMLSVGLPAGVLAAEFLSAVTIAAEPLAGGVDPDEDLERVLEDEDEGEQP